MSWLESKVPCANLGCICGWPLADKFSGREGFFEEITGLGVVLFI